MVLTELCQQVDCTVDEDLDSQDEPDEFNIFQSALGCEYDSESSETTSPGLPDPHPNVDLDPIKSFL